TATLMFSAVGLRDPEDDTPDNLLTADTCFACFDNENTFAIIDVVARAVCAVGAKGQTFAPSASSEPRRLGYVEFRELTANVIRRLLEPLMAPAAPSAAPQLRLSVRLRSADPQELEELVRRGFEIERLDRDLMRAEGRVHPRDVYRLAELPFVAALKPVHPAWLRVGSATTEGDAASRAPLVRAQGFDGAGTVVGVISDGVD